MDHIRVELGKWQDKNFIEHGFIYSHVTGKFYKGFDFPCPEYRKPFYDPFEIFHPTKTFIREVIKQLKQQCYELLNDSRNDDFAKICNQPKLEALNRRIRDYEFRLRGQSQANKITRDHSLQAKQHPIQEYFTGRLHRAGKNFTGICPFHQEKSGSFTIYTDKNRFHCFGCGLDGDVIDFVGKTYNLSFINSVKLILKI